jgi:hypothetical protein
MNSPMNLDWKLHYLRVVIDDGEPERRAGDVFDWFAIGLGLTLRPYSRWIISPLALPQHDGPRSRPRFQTPDPLAVV